MCYRLATSTVAGNRFEAFASWKTAEAAAAELPAYVTEFERVPGEFESVGNDWSRRVFDGAFFLSPATDPARPACSLVFVQSSDGNTVTADPSKLGGGRTDKHLIYEGLSQVAADAVLSGANTIGGDIVFSVWHPELVRLREALGKPRHPVQIIATLRGLDLDDHLLFNVPAVQVIIVTIGSGVERMRHGLRTRPWVAPLVMDRPDDLTAAFEELRARGIGRISAVGGRTLATELLDARLVQDLYLTTAALPGGEAGTPVYPRPLQFTTLLRKHGTGLESGVVFEHRHIHSEPHGHT
jgi:riboflavin biosynthesis pyrimidine reductase